MIFVPNVGWFLQTAKTHIIDIQIIKKFACFSRNRESWLVIDQRESLREERQ